MVRSRFPGRADLIGAVQRLGVVARRVTPTNRRLIEASRRLGSHASLVEAKEAGRRLRLGDVALARLDVLPTLDGIEPGLECLSRLEERGVHVLNRAGSLLTAHDKLATALRLAAAGIPHPRTAHVGEDGHPDLELPVVVKPRFGSWGRDVVVCSTRLALGRCLRRLGERPWFRQHGALVQELVPPVGHDLRLIVAGSEVVGAIERVARAGEWRTNVALGGARRAVAPELEACLLAAAAADTVGGDLVGVDLLPDGEGGYVVLELNGAVDFTQDYSLDGANVFERAIRALLGARYAGEGEEEAEEEAVRLSAGSRT